MVKIYKQRKITNKCYLNLITFVVSPFSFIIYQLKGKLNLSNTLLLFF